MRHGVILTFALAVAAPSAMRLASDALIAAPRSASLSVVAAIASHLFLALGVGAAAASTAATPSLERHLARWLGDALRCACVTLALVALWIARDGSGADPTLLLVSGIAGVLVPAIAEETVYRGILPRMLDRALRAALTRPAARGAAIALLTSLAFGAAHPGVLGPPFDAGLLAAHTVAGLAFFALRGTRSSLLAPMCAHVAYNGAVLIAMK